MFNTVENQIAFTTCRLQYTKLSPISIIKKADYLQTIQ